MNQFLNNVFLGLSKDNVVKQNQGGVDKVHYDIFIFFFLVKDIVPIFEYMESELLSFFRDVYFLG
jgi:hypothetical protein